MQLDATQVQQITKLKQACGASPSHDPPEASDEHDSSTRSTLGGTTVCQLSEQTRRLASDFGQKLHSS